MNKQRNPVTLLVIGAGGRGKGYSTFASEYPSRAKVVGVAEPRQEHRLYMMDNYLLDPQNVFSDWQEAAEKPRMADAVIISTQDAMHAEAAIAFSKKDYDILLEKPMAPNEEDCKKITEAVLRTGVLCAVCHVLRYTHYTQTLKAMLTTGLIGEVINIQHMEPVGYWHQAHSFVRGNWRNEAESSSMLLAKSVHDLDWIRYMMGVKCQSVSSFGSLKHFRSEEKPVDASDRCLSCLLETECPYSAKKLYLKMVEAGNLGWPVNVLTLNPTVETVTNALETGPYGRCVYSCDNDVVDNQVVNLLFEGGKTASFTMTAFTETTHRRTRIFGTRGELYGDGDEIYHYDFLTDEKRTISTKSSDGTVLGGHGGGDYGLMDRFIRAVSEGDSTLILSGVAESLETHRMVFAAETARHEHRVVDL